MSPVKPLTYRQKQALQTRQLIVEASKELFLSQGYGITTIETIAEKAGVAVSTVYSIFGNKRGILKDIREEWHQNSSAKDIYQAAMNEANPKKRLERFAHGTRRQWETSAAMMAIYQGAAAIDAEAAAELQEAVSGRRKNLGRWLEGSASLFSSKLSLERVKAIYLSLTRPEVYLELVHGWGWSPDEYEAWLAKTLEQQLLLD